MDKEKAFAIVRYDSYLAEHDVSVELRTRVVKVYLDANQADVEAARLNTLRPDQGSHYWVSPAKLVR